MTKSKRTAAALEALRIKRAIPPGLTAIDLPIRLPDNLVERFRSLSTVERGRVVEAGLNAIDRLEHLGENGNGN